MEIQTFQSSYMYIYMYNHLIYILLISKILWASLLFVLVLCSHNNSKCTVPAQHGIGLCSEDGRIYYKACVVNNQSDPFWGPNVSVSDSGTGSSLLGILVDKDHFSNTQAFEGAFSTGQAAVTTAHHPTTTGATGRDSLRPWTTGPWWWATISITVYKHKVEQHPIK